jgi:hypothetical protein
LTKKGNCLFWLAFYKFAFLTTYQNIFQVELQIK